MSPTPGSARTQVKGCFRILTTTERAPLPSPLGEPIARPSIHAAQTTRIPRALTRPITGRLHGRNSTSDCRRTAAAPRPADHRPAPLQDPPGFKSGSLPRTRPADHRPAPLQLDLAPDVGVRLGVARPI